MTETKTCSKCGEEKALDLFPLRKGSPDFRSGQCKACKNAQLRDWRNSNRSAVIKQRLEYYQAAKKRHAETILHQHRKRCCMCENVKSTEMFRKKQGTTDGLDGLCKDCANDRQRKRRSENPDYDKEWQKRWREANREKAKQRSLDYMTLHREEIRSAQQKRRDGLSDSYIKMCLSQGNPSIYRLLSQPIIEAKRVQIQIKRFLKERAK